MVITNVSIPTLFQDIKKDGGIDIGVQQNGDERDMPTRVTYAVGRHLWEKLPELQGATKTK